MIWIGGLLGQPSGVGRTPPVAPVMCHRAVVGGPGIVAPQAVRTTVVIELPAPRCRLLTKRQALASR